MKIAIIGGGFIGLTAAYFLSKKGFKVTLFEKDFVLGGLAASFKLDNIYTEKFVHHFFKKDTEAVNLIKELGLEDKLIWRTPKNAIFYKEKIYPFTTPFDLLNFSPLSFSQRLRCGTFSLYLKFQKNYHYFENISTEEWLSKFMGEKVWQVIWKPLLKKKFGKDYQQISMSWFWARVFYRSNSLGYVSGSLKKLTDKLESEIAKNGGRVFLNKEVKNLKTLVARYEKILVTTSPEVFLDIAKDQLPVDYQKKLKKIDYYSAISLVLLLKRNLIDDVYWLNINDFRIPFVVFVEHNNFIEPEDNGFNRIAYLETYLELKSRHFLLPDKQIFENWVPFLQKINPNFNKNWIVSFKVFKEKFAQPVVKVGYPSKIPAVTTPIKNVFFTSMCQVYPADRGVNFAIKLGRKVAEDLTKF